MEDFQMNDLQIYYFLALCKYNNFSETARRLYVSQPAVSKQIFSLEEELGVTLFKREYKKIHLTEEGKILQKTLEQTVQMIQDAKAEMYQQSHPEEYSLKIGILQGLDIADLMKPVLQKFEKHYPNVNLSLECFSHKKLNSMIRQDDLDLIITLSREARNDNLLQTRDIFSTDLAFTVHESHPLFGTTVITAENLKHQRILISAEGTKGSSSFINLLQTYYHITEEQFLFLGSMDELISYLASGSGIAVLSGQKRFSRNHYRQFPLKDVSEIITAAWFYNNHNPARTFLLDEITKSGAKNQPE